jgi:hypothetical protein
MRCQEDITMLKLLLLLLSGLCVVFLHGCHHAAPLKAEEMETHCLGRYLLDVPKDSRLAVYGYTVGTDRLYSVKGSREDFQAEIQEILAKRNPENGATEKAPSDDDELAHYRLIKTVFPLTDTKQIIVSGAKNGYLIEAFVKPDGDYFFHLQTKVKMRPGGEVRAQKTVDESVARLDKLLSAIRFRQNKEIPSEAGVCIDNGFIADHGEPLMAMGGVEAVFVLNKHCDVKMELEILISYSGEYSLLKRQSHAHVVESFPERDPETVKTEITGIIEPKWPWVIQRVRAGALTINGMAGEESLAYFPSDDIPGIAHKFSWATPGEKMNPYKPFIRFDIVSGLVPYVLITDRMGRDDGITGALGHSSLDTRQVQDIYERTVKTIRPRPVETGK